MGCLLIEVREESAGAVTRVRISELTLKGLWQRSRLKKRFYRRDAGMAFPRLMVSLLCGEHLRCTIAVRWIRLSSKMMAGVLSQWNMEALTSINICTSFRMPTELIAMTEPKISPFGRNMFMGHFGASPPCVNHSHMATYLSTRHFVFLSQLR